MHELSVCQALLSQVAAIAQAQGSELVERITIEVGPLSGAEPALLLNAFRAMRTGSMSAAELHIHSCAVSIECVECGSQSETPPNRLICAQCGGWRTRVIGGDALRLLRVEMRVPDAPPIPRSTRPVEQCSHV